MFLIRTNYDSSSGAGHYVRCLRIAEELKIKRGHDVIFILDKKIDNFYYNNKFKHIFIYENENYENEKIDAKIVKKKIRFYKPSHIIVDDYRLSKTWEKKVKTKILKLIVIDDFIDRKHHCDYYINFKNFENFEYKKLNKTISKKTKKILGHKYSIINSKLKKIINPKKSVKNIVFYPGNSGDPIIFYDVLIKVLKKIKSNSLSVKINFFLGKKKNTSSQLVKLSNKYSNLKIIENKFNLHKYLNNADLFIGFSGNLIYENSYLKLLSIFFPISPNQNNSVYNLESLGHYFIMKKTDLKYSEKISSLLHKILVYPESKKKMFFKNSLVTKKGPELILNQILDLKNNKKRLGKKVTERAKNNKNFKVLKTSIEDINNYLYCRNKIINRKYMINKKEISNLEHYNWWLSDFQSRENFNISIGDKKIFVWHKLIKINNNKYLVGGWFSSGTDIPINFKIATIKWQLEYTKKYQTRWIAVIKKNNIATFKINTFLGWKKSNKNKKIFKDIKLYFNVSEKLYYLMHY